MELCNRCLRSIFARMSTPSSPIVILDILCCPAILSRVRLSTEREIEGVVEHVDIGDGLVFQYFVISIKKYVLQTVGYIP